MSSGHTKTKIRRFQIPSFSWRISVDGRPNRRNKGAFSNFSGVVWTLPHSYSKILTWAVLDLRNQSNRNCGALLHAILSSSYTFSLSNPSLCSMQIWRTKKVQVYQHSSFVDTTSMVPRFFELVLYARALTAQRWDKRQWWSLNLEHSESPNVLGLMDSKWACKSVIFTSPFAYRPLQNVQNNGQIYTWGKFRLRRRIFTRRRLIRLSWFTRLRQPIRLRRMSRP